MTNLKIEDDMILEISYIFTDGKLNTMVRVPNLIINQPKECLQKTWINGVRRIVFLVDL